MRPWGVADELVACGQRTVAAQMFVEKRLGVSVGFDDIGVDDTPYPFLLFVSQAVTEKLLRRGAGAARRRRRARRRARLGAR